MNRAKTDCLYLFRFLAASAIVLFHHEPSIVQQSLAHRWVRHAGEFVNFFFFLSGFVLVYAYHSQISRSQVNPISFYIKRFARIYPTYALALVLVLAFHFFVASTFTSLAVRVPLELSCLNSWVFGGAINYPGWSISCEFFFYLVFPLVSVFWFKHFRKVPFWLLPLIAVLLAISLSYLKGVFTGFDNGMLKRVVAGMSSHPLMRVSVFLVGVDFAFRLLEAKSFDWVRKWSVAGCLGTLVVAATILYYLPPEWNWIDFGILAPLYSVFFLFALNLPHLVARSISGKTCILLGEASYALYILQYPVYLFLTQLLPDDHSFVYWLIYFLILTIVSIATHYAFEVPLRGWLTKRLLPLDVRSADKPRDQTVAGVARS